jgi:hypothetical protein
MADWALARTRQPASFSEYKTTFLTKSRIDNEVISPFIHCLSDMFEVVIDISFGDFQIA